MRVPTFSSPQEDDKFENKLNSPKFSDLTDENVDNKHIVLNEDHSKCVTPMYIQSSIEQSHNSSIQLSDDQKESEWELAHRQYESIKPKNKPTHSKARSNPPVSNPSSFVSDLNHAHQENNFPRPVKNGNEPLRPLDMNLKNESKCNLPRQMMHKQSNIPPHKKIASLKEQLQTTKDKCQSWALEKERIQKSHSYEVDQYASSLSTLKDQIMVGPNSKI